MLAAATCLHEDEGNTIREQCYSVMNHCCDGAVVELKDMLLRPPALTRRPSSVRSNIARQPTPADML